MNIDATESADEEVLLPSNTSTDGIEKELETEQEAQSTVEPSSTSEEVHEEKSNGVQKRINDLTAKRYTAEREAKEAKEKLAQYEASQNSEPKVSPDIVAPSLPDDMYDEEAMRKYHQDMVNYTTTVSASAAKSTFESQKQQTLQQEQEAQQRKMIDTYANNAIRDGVDINKLQAVEQTLASAGITPELGRYIMADNNGAKIAEYLADNPSEMYSVLQMDPVSAGIEIATKIKPKVLATTPKVSNAPQPIPDVSGGGYIEKDDFDKSYAGYEIL